MVSLSLLYHSDATTAEARAYLKQANAARRAASGEEEAPVEEIAEDAEEGVEEATLTPERYAALGAREQFVLAVSQTGFGKRSSSYEYRVTGRGGSGIVAMGMGKKNSAVDRRLPGRGQRRSDADQRRAARPSASRWPASPSRAAPPRASPCSGWTRASGRCRSNASPMSAATAA